MSEDNAPKRKCLNMIWANEAGVSVYLYEAEHNRRTIEIHGVVNDYETVLATATIENHNRDRFAETMARVHAPTGKVSERDETDSEAARQIVKRCGLRDGLFKGPRTLNAVESIAYALTTVRKEARAAAFKEIVTFAKSRFSDEVASAIKAAANTQEGGGDG